MSQTKPLQIAVRIAIRAGSLIRDRFVSQSSTNFSKGHLDIVTTADLEAANFISASIRQAFPQDSLFCEESGWISGSSGRIWYIDPLDGTKNFAHSLPHFCTMISLEENGLMQLAVIHDPMRHETFCAARGEGASCNSIPIQVSSNAALDQAMIASGFPSGKRHRGFDPAPFYRVCNAAQGLRRSGSTGLDLAYVACGRFDALWDLGLEKWDVAAGLLLVQEAGGVCTGWNSEPYKLGDAGLIAANPAIQQLLLGFLQSGPDLP